MPCEQYKNWEQECLAYLPKVETIDQPVNIKATFYMRTKRRVDLTNLLEALDDMLVHYGIIAEDNRDVVAGHDGSRVYCDKEKPRCEVEITSIENYERWKKIERAESKKAHC